MRALRRRLRGGDEGFALATVLAITLICAIAVTVMLTATMRSIASTTSTRASVQAEATAQAGIDTVRAQLDSGACSAGTVTGTGWTVTIHPSTTSSASASDAVGCPSSGAQSVFLVSTGTASSTGIGSAAGDTRTVQSLLTKPSSTPKFNKAAFGKNGVNLSTNLKLLDATSAKSADVFTEGTFTCASNMTIQGSVYAKAGATFSSAPCQVEGNVLTEGNFTCAAGTVIGGDLYVGGNADFTSAACDIRGIVHVGGNVSMPNGGTKLGTSLTVKGQFSISGLPATSVTAITVGGRVNSGTGYWYDELRKAWGSRLAENATVAVPTKYPTDEADTFPVLRADDPLITTGFTSRSWSSTVLDAMTSGSKPSGCSLEWGGNRYTAPIKITTNTRMDARTECASGITMGMGLWFELSADLVIIADSIQQNGDIKITSGDGKKHSLYLISPWAASATTCSTSGSGISFTSGTWNQDPVTSVLLYSAKPLSIVTTPTLYGQAYGCTLSLSTSTVLNYSPVGATADPTSASWALIYIRDAG